jgi:hypothetical protein
MENFPSIPNIIIKKWKMRIFDIIIIKKWKMRIFDILPILQILQNDMYENIATLPKLQISLLALIKSSKS